MSMTHSPGIDPGLKAMAEKCGGVIKKRKGELWLEPASVQLTYKYETKNGQQSACSPARRMQIAVGILSRIIKARDSREPAPLRYVRFLEKLRREKAKYIHGNFMYVRDESLDQGVLLNMGGKATIWVELGDCERYEVNGRTFDECFAKLEAMPSPPAKKQEVGP